MIGWHKPFWIWDQPVLFRFFDNIVLKHFQEDVYVGLRRLFNLILFLEMDSRNGMTPGLKKTSNQKVVRLKSDAVIRVRADVESHSNPSYAPILYSSSSFA